MAIGKYDGVNQALGALSNTFRDVYARNRQAEIDAQNAKTQEQAQQLNALRLQSLKRAATTQDNLDAYVSNLDPNATSVNRVAGLAKFAAEKGDAGMLDFTDTIMKNAPDTLQGAQLKREVGDVSTVLTEVANLKKTGQWNEVTSQALFDKLPQRMKEFFPNGFSTVTDNGAVVVKDPDTGSTVGYMITNPQSGKVIFQAAAKSKNTATGQLNPDGSLTLENGMIYSKQQLQNMAETYSKTGKMPSLGMKAGPLRQAIMYYHTLNAVDNNKSGTDIAVDWALTKADSQSLAKQTTNFDMASSFINNIDKQVDRFETTLAPVIKRLDTRLANVPVNKWQEVIAGDPEWAKYRMYITEISSETARLASGNPQSIAELSQSAREKWENIHDLNMSPSNMLSLLKETQHAAHLRYDSLKEQLDKTRARMTGKPAGAKPLTKELAIQYLQQAGGDKDKARQLARDAGYSF